VLEWEARASDLARYPYPISLKPHPFMGLNKFDEGSLHQMRSGKSYLRADPSWDNENHTTCPGCAEVSENFRHCMASCPVGEPSRNRYLQALTEIGFDAAVWSSAPLLGALSDFFRSTKTAFPPGMFSRPSSASSSIPSHSSNVVSFGYFMSSQEVYVRRTDSP